MTGPPTLNNGLITDTNIFGSDGDADPIGHHFNFSFTAWATYRIRVINGAIGTHWKFSIDNHTLTVIAAGLLPIEPYTTAVQRHRHG
jgi:FtsP/CotA-like multicopper oxidase with cupredoxin domain